MAKKEYIERGAVMLKIDLHGTNKFGMLDEDIREFVKEIPTADVVEVVRCKDCKWWHTDGCAFRKDAVKDLPAADDFCSHGERKE